MGAEVRLHSHSLFLLFFLKSLELAYNSNANLQQNITNERKEHDGN